MGLAGSSHVGPDGAIDESTALNISNNVNYAESASSYGTMSKPELPFSRDVPGDIEENGTERALLSPQASPKEDSVKVSTSIWGVISVLLLGEFVANADTTLVFASAGKISSEFASFQDANWLSTAYTLGVCVAQPMCGKLSDIYGRKPLLLLAYAFFALGSLICGLGRGMWQVILGRAISGIGGAGTITVAAVIITDLVPKREIAAWRAYVNISMTLGRSLGGPTGGWLTDTFGWRWVFLIQAPLFCITALLVTLKLRIAPQHDTHIESPDSTTGSKSKLSRVDFLGTVCLATSIISAILLLDLGGRKFPWLSLQSLLLSTTAITSLILFILVEAYIAPEPIFSLRILREPNVLTSYAVMSLQIFAQVSMMFCVPLYFQVTSLDSAAGAGAHLVPAVMGNAVGGLTAGAIVKKTGRYKSLTVSAGLIASVTYILLYLRWNGSTDILESLYILPGGFGTGVAQACVFVSMTALLDPAHVAMATGGLFLYSNFGITGGITASNAVLDIKFRRLLERNLTGFEGAEEIIRQATSDARYISTLQGWVREIVVACYVEGLKGAYLLSLTGSLTASVIALTIRGHQL